MQPSAGAHSGIPFDQYSAWDAINWHTLKPMRESALQARHENAIPPDATKSMILGGAGDMAILEPEKFDATYAVMPTFSGHANSNAHKAEKAKWMEQHQQYVALDNTEMSMVRGMQRAVYAHPTSSAILKSRGRNQLSIVWKDKETESLCKGRIDRLCRIPARVLDPSASGDLICLVDVKTTSFIGRFDNEVAKFGYHGQLAFYADGLAAIEPASITPLIIAIQNEAPFDVVVFTMADAVEEGRKLYRRLLRQYIECRRTNYWPGICPKAGMPCVLPKWAREDESEL